MTSAMRRRRFRWLQFGDPPPMRCFVFRLLLPWLLNWWWRQSFIGNHRPSPGMWLSLGGTMTRGHRRRRRIVSFSFSDQWRVPIWFDPSDGERIHNKKLCFSGEGGGSISSCSSKISRLRVLLFSPHHAKSKANKKKNRICLHKSLFRYCAHSSSPLLLLTFFFQFFSLTMTYQTKNVKVLFLLLSLDLSLPSWWHLWTLKGSWFDEIFSPFYLFVTHAVRGVVETERKGKNESNDFLLAERRALKYDIIDSISPTWYI